MQTKLSDQAAPIDDTVPMGSLFNNSTLMCKWCPVDPLCMVLERHVSGLLASGYSHTALCMRQLYAAIYRYMQHSVRLVR